MLDYEGATKACVAASTNKVLTSMGVVSASYAKKSDWKVAIEGSYALLFPLIHTHFPSRDEVQNYVAKYVQDAFDTHHKMNHHLWTGNGVTFVEGGTTTVSIDTSLMTPSTNPSSGLIFKFTRSLSGPSAAATSAGGDNDPALESLSENPEQIEIWIDSPAAQYLQL